MISSSTTSMIGCTGGGGGGGIGGGLVYGVHVPQLSQLANAALVVAVVVYVAFSDIFYVFLSSVFGSGILAFPTNSTHLWISHVVITVVYS